MALLLLLGLRVAADGLDGTVDPAFVGPGFATSSVSQILLRSDGSLLVQGAFSTYDGVRTGRIARVLPNGSLGPPALSLPGFDAALVDGLIAPAPGDGFYLLGGPPNQHRLHRFDAQGNQVAVSDLQNISGPISVIRAAPDGKLYLGGDFEYGTVFQDFRYLVRFHPDLTLDETFEPYNHPNGPVREIIVQPDGRVLIAGDFGSFGLGETPTPGGYARLLADGTLDPAFIAGVGTGVPGLHPKPISVDGQGRSYWTQTVGNFLSSFNGVSRSGLVRLLADGNVDLAFDAQFPFGVVANAVRQTDDGKVLVAGFFTQAGGGSRRGVARLTDTGTLDPTFEVQGQGFFNPAEIVAAPGGGWYVAGLFGRLDGVARTGLARLGPDGAVDTVFAPSQGPGSGAPTVRAIVGLPDGRILVAGSLQESAPGVPAQNLLRLQPGGALDPTFSLASEGADLSINSILRQTDGKLVVGGSFRRLGGQARGRIARLLPDGALDTSFDPGSGFDAGVTGIRQLSDGSLIVIGQFTVYDGHPAPSIARLTPNGQMHPDFQPGTGFGTFFPEAIELGADDRIVACGSFTSYAGTTRYRVLELLPNGTLSTSALGTTQAVPSGSVRSLARAANGFTYVTRNTRVYRFNAAGALDGTYSGQLPGTAPINALLLHPDGSLHAAADAVYRLRPNGSIDTGFLAQPAISRDFGYAPGAGLPGRLRSLAFGPNRAAIYVGGTFHTLGGLERSGLARLVARPYDAWLGTYFNTAELSDPTVSGDQADPDGDGLSNLLEYALALDPRLSSAAGAPQVALVGRRGESALELVFRRPKLPRGVVYALEASSDLQNWAVTAASEEQVDEGNAERVKLRDTVPALPGPPRFLRLRVMRDS